MALPQRKQDATDARLAAVTLPDGPAWLTKARKAALARVSAMGLPARRDEYWKFSDPTTLTDTAVISADLADASDREFAGADALMAVFVDGAFDANASDDLEAAGVTITRLAQAQDITWAGDLLGTLEARGQSPVER
ncbi:MAG: Fe-S cluster assembly protein SufD, partial [Alphaproteobacteria bacterium]|nr:Fe-S cluster assembly protein SufD [Alphaproteobacteria bacterium]